jgi:hypothetical protein
MSGQQPAQNFLLECCWEKPIRYSDNICPKGKEVVERKLLKGVVVGTITVLMLTST